MSIRLFVHHLLRTRNLNRKLKLLNLSLRITETPLGPKVGGYKVLVLRFRLVLKRDASVILSTVERAMNFSL